jgi:uncharacterized membrane protein
MVNAQANVAYTTDEHPTIQHIEPTELIEVLRRGLDDFLYKPSHVVFIAVIYPLIGLVLGRLTFGYDILPLLFPLAAGFALVGPFAAIGLYELSRRRELGLSPGWGDVFATLGQKSMRPLLQLGAVLAVLFVAWLAAAQWIYWAAFGNVDPASVTAFIDEVFTTSHGWALLIFGNAVGFVFAVIVLVISVVSFPLVVDRQTGALTAIRVSVAACVANPVPMALWGLVVGALLAIGSLPFFAGLAIVLPVLGHATWHLYRKLIAR